MTYRHSKLPLTTLTLLSLLCLLTVHAQNLTITPASVTNTVRGPVTLAITSLNSGETVRLEKFMDLNGNDAVDAADPLILRVALTDGVRALMGGVRDLNVPDDADGTVNGQIRVEADSYRWPEFESGLGRYLYRVSSPTDRFSPVVKPLLITQAAQAQALTGVVNDGSAPVPYALIAVLEGTTAEGSYLAGTSADAAGRFSIGMPPGTYQLLAIQPGFVANLVTAPRVALPAGLTVAQDLTLTAATRLISGRISDSVTDVAIPGLQMFLMNDNNDFTLTFTDANGNFTAPVTPSTWYLEPAESALPSLGYLRSRDGLPTPNTSTGNVTGVSVRLTKGTALIYGDVQDDLARPLPGVGLYASAGDSFGYSGSGFSDSQGRYSIAVLPEHWWVGANEFNPSLAGMILQQADVTVDPGTAVRTNLVARRATARLSGRTVDPLGAPFTTSLRLNAWSINNFVSTSTDTSGAFDFPLLAGVWRLQVEDGSAADAGIVGPQLEFNLGEGVSITNLLVVVRPATAWITGRATVSGGAPLSGLWVHAGALINGTNYTAGAQTDGGGNYTIPVAVANNPWTVSPDCGDLMNRGYQCPVPQPATLNTPGQTVTVNFVVFSAPPNPPSLVPLSPAGGQFRCRLDGEAGRSYRVWATSSLTSPDWTPIRTDAGPSFEFTDPLPLGSGQRFYGAEVLP